MLEDKKKSEIDLFMEFYQDMTTSEFTEDKKEMVETVIEKARKEVDPA